MSERSAETTRKVLVVDDNEDAAVMLSMALEMMGFETVVAHDGYSALEEAARFQPDVALIDIGLPGIDGYEVARQMRGILGHVQLVAVTGYGLDTDRQRSREAGFDHHLVKPVELAAVRALLARAA
jgi:CheY-like chemotaxis protein